jgi:hypothetical protein
MKVEVTNDMLCAGVKQAVKEGLLPKVAGTDDYIKYYENIKKIIEAALEQQ